jgi:hypothetical protein
MNAFVRKFYALPGIWQLWSLPVLSSVFTSGGIESTSQSRVGEIALCLIHGTGCN